MDEGSDPGRRRGGAVRAQPVLEMWPVTSLVYEKPQPPPRWSESNWDKLFRR